jgi:hypothetical protein
MMSGFGLSPMADTSEARMGSGADPGRAFTSRAFIRSQSSTGFGFPVFPELEANTMTLNPDDVIPGSVDPSAPPEFTPPVDTVKDQSNVEYDSRKALAADLRIVADLLEKGNYAAIPDILRVNLPQFLFEHVSRFVGKLTSDLLRT